MNLTGTPTLFTKRCTLRRMVPDDYRMMYENWAKYEEVCRFFPFHPIADIEIYREKVNKWCSSYASPSYLHWVIVWNQSGEVIGTINLGNVDEASEMADTAYMLSPRYWGLGIMTEALQAVLSYAFGEAGFNRVQAEVFDGNAASARVLAKCSMQLEGVARQRYRKDGQWIDVAQYAVLKRDYCSL